ncbi:acyltransferase family protein [Dysgonomonas sp. ZJ279]|uniref:acyltransferase family protein n=1 Tax=Dysgonomonas sp. ZJ279 TaxID=2709796 RepID=UPI0013EC49ED|nr:acyltransferase family protein [Dysgonomonas sp. ZJ279]
MALARYNWIDWAKFIGIYLIVLGHSSIPFLLREVIYWFHVPLFFIISGFLHKNRNTRDGIKRDVQTLILPYLLMNFIGLLYVIINNARYGIENNIFDILKCIQAILLGELASSDFNILGFTRPTWFLLALFVTKTIFNVINCDRNNYILLVICFLSASLVYISDKLGYVIPYYYIQSALLAIPFFLFGYFLKKNNVIQLIRALPLYMHLIIFSVISLIVIYIGLYNSNGHIVELFHCFWGRNLFLFYFVAILASLSIFIICFQLDKYSSKLLTTIANNTILIIGTNYLLIRWLDAAWSHFDLPVVPFFSLFSSLFILIAHYPIILILERYFPEILGKRRKITEKL